MPANKINFSWKVIPKILIVVLLIICANWLAAVVTDSLNIEIRPSNEDLVHRMVMLSAIVYSMLIAMPFVPGIEVGLALIGLLGTRIVFLVYVSTIVGLTMSFIVGRIISLNGLIRLLENLNFKRSSMLLKNIEPMDGKDRLAYLLQKAPNQFIPILLRHRYLALVLLINLPGNFLIGGGGGISLVAGISRLYSLPGFLIAIAIGVSPVPLAIYFFGSKILQ